MKTKVKIHKKAQKQLKRLPSYIQFSLLSWIKELQLTGLQKTRENKGYHDEPLKGDRVGQRSVRLNRSYRAIYIEENGVLEILVLEVNKHEY